MTHPFSDLQAWYLAQCNDDWEHSYGVKIDTLDNPGWTLDVDLIETDLEGIVVPLKREVRSQDDWVQFEATGTQFRAAGGPMNLQELIESFLAFASRAQET
jgi:hypothetical protein